MDAPRAATPDTPATLLAGPSLAITVTPGWPHPDAPWRKEALFHETDTLVLPLSLRLRCIAVGRGLARPDDVLTTTTRHGRAVLAALEHTDGAGVSGTHGRLLAWAAEARHMRERWGVQHLIVPDVASAEEADAFAALGATVVDWDPQARPLPPERPAPPARWVLLSGGSGTGKDYLTDTYLRPQGFRAIGLADYLKYDTIQRGELTYAEAIHTRPPHARSWLQWQGSRGSRDRFGEQYWPTVLEQRARYWAAGHSMQTWFIPDNRFPNELAFFKDRQSLNLRIQAPGRYAANALTPEQRAHPSERALDAHGDLYTTLANDFGDEATVGPRLTQYLAEHPWPEAAPPTASPASPTADRPLQTRPRAVSGIGAPVRRGARIAP